MDSVFFNGFSDELKKIASHGLELAGLGMLAGPSAYHLATGKEPKEKTKSKLELAGLGTLAAGTVKSMMSKAPKLAADLWNPETGARSEETKIRGSVLEKQRGAAPAPALKPASSIRGAPYRGAPVAPVAKPFAQAASAGPRIAPLAKVTSGAPAATSVGSKLLGGVKKLFR